jgi:hypothetical protein
MNIMRLAIIFFSVAGLGCGGSAPIPETPPVLHVQLPPVEVKLPQTKITLPIPPKKTIPISLNKIRRWPELALYEADKTKDGHTWTWKNRNETVVITAEGLDEDHLFSCTAAVYQFDPHQPQADMSVGIGYLSSLFHHESAYRKEMYHHWIEERPLLPSVITIGGSANVEFKMVKGASMIVVTPGE